MKSSHFKKCLNLDLPKRVHHFILNCYFKVHVVDRKRKQKYDFLIIIVLINLNSVVAYGLDDIYKTIYADNISRNSGANVMKFIVKFY